MKYQKYYEELKSIISELESGDVSIDELANKIKRAQKLIDSCESILTGTQKSVEKILLVNDENQKSSKS